MLRIVKTEVIVIEDFSAEAAARKTAGLLLRGGVCVIPTDTIYGIIALDQFPDAVRRICDIKKRPSSKPFIRLIGSMEALGRYTEQELPGELSRYWPGPLTVVFRGSGGGTVAVRLPDDAFLTRIFSLVGNSGIVAPSANISGEAEIGNCAGLRNAFGGKVDLIVCRKGRLKSMAASTMVDITTNPWRILRQGSIFIETDSLKP